VASEPILAALDVAVVDRTGSAPNVLSDYWMLTKPEVNLLIGITTGSTIWIGTPLLPRVCVPEYAVWHAASSERSRDHSSTDCVPLPYKMRRMRRPFVAGRIQRLSASKLEVKAT
jgi:hypothetical protein